MEAERQRDACSARKRGLPAAERALRKPCFVSASASAMADPLARLLVSVFGWGTPEVRSRPIADEREQWLTLSDHGAPFHLGVAAVALLGEVPPSPSRRRLFPRSRRRRRAVHSQRSLTRLPSERKSQGCCRGSSGSCFSWVSLTLVSGAAVVALIMSKDGPWIGYFREHDGHRLRPPGRLPLSARRRAGTRGADGASRGCGRSLPSPGGRPLAVPVKFAPTAYPVVFRHADLPVRRALVGGGTRSRDTPGMALLALAAKLGCCYAYRRDVPSIGRPGTTLPNAPIRYGWRDALALVR